MDKKRFEEFKNSHGKFYETAEEELKRFTIFRRNLLKIKILNSIDTATYEVNHLADLSGRFISLQLYFFVNYFFVFLRSFRISPLILNFSVNFISLEEEFQERYTGLVMPNAAHENVGFPDFLNETAEVPKEFDWREKGAVTEVKVRFLIHLNIDQKNNSLIFVANRASYLRL